MRKKTSILAADRLQKKPTRSPKHTFHTNTRARMSLLLSASSATSLRASTVYSSSSSSSSGRRQLLASSSSSSSNSNNRNSDRKVRFGGGSIPIEAAKKDAKQLAPKKGNGKQQQQQQQSAVSSETPEFLAVSKDVVSSQPFAFLVGFVGAIAIIKAHKRDKTNTLRKKKAVLRYFDAKGAAEVIRTLFAAAECDYEDFRYKFNMVDNKPTIEKQHPLDKERGLFKQNLDRLPILEHSGMSVGQSKTIERYVARDLGLYGKNMAESWRIDAFGEHVRDVKDAWAKVRGNPFAPPDDEQIAKKEKWYDEDMIKWCERLEKVIENGEEGFVVGDKTSLADVVLYVTMTQTFDDAARAEKARENCPKMTKVIENVGNLPGVKTWLASRPENRF
jgi:glutathione S-transferase